MKHTAFWITIILLLGIIVIEGEIVRERFEIRNPRNKFRDDTPSPTPTPTPTPVPSPPTAWPAVWHTWLVTTISEEGKDGLLYAKGQLIAFDSDEQYACRYDEQDLLNKTATQTIDICDYVTGFHYSVNETNGDSSLCNGITKVRGPLKPIQWPVEFTSKAQFEGVDRVGQANCNHWTAPSVTINGQTVLMDIWTDIDKGFPCSIHVMQTINTTRIHTTWAFNGFNNAIPPDAMQCTSPKVICSEPDWICVAKPGMDLDSLGQALQWVCNPDNVNCDPINPGGKYYNANNTTPQVSDWAFNLYYQKYRSKQGEFACDFNGVAHLVPPRNATSTRASGSGFEFGKDVFSVFEGKVFSNDIICPAAGDP